MMDQVGDEVVRIKAFQLISDHRVPNLPPIQSDVITEVPMWLAIRLTSCDRCELILPEWLDEDHLQDVFLKEAGSEEFVEGLPYYYYEFFHLLWAKVGHVFSRRLTIQSIVEQIHTQRLVKVDRLIPKPDISAVDFANLGHAELKKVRPIVRAISQTREVLFGR